MQLKSEVQTGFKSEIKIVPRWAWTLAVTGFFIAQFFFNVVVPRNPEAPPAWARVPLGLLLGLAVGSYLLFIGYINRDAKRRGMNSLLWTIVALFIPNALGIILYFVLRQPLRSACPKCGCAVETGFNFCPRCSYKLSPSCPQCKRVVGIDEIYCADCGIPLRNRAVPTSNPSTE
jgi:Phospholipase_D-nuclease N-terminal